MERRKRSDDQSILLKISASLFALFLLGKVFPFAVIVLEEQSRERGMIARAQAAAVENYLGLNPKENR